ncbi:unnamed protein product [Citrullus colocynthis]|uniref:Uncharacterized protein n=1 Tax=Citrullus colocynthis TaxID=252529 RepID=A0ABP0XLK7_9ROSI
MGRCRKTNLWVDNLQPSLQMRRQPLSGRKNSGRRANLWFQQLPYSLEAADLRQGRRFRRPVLELKRPPNSPKGADLGRFGWLRWRR